MQFLRGLSSQSLLQVVGNLVGIYEEAVHALCHVPWSHAVEAVRVDERVALHHLHAILESCSAQLLVIVILRCLHKEVAPHYGIHQHGDAAMLTCLTHKAGQVVVEGGAWVGMPVSLWLLVVVAELNDDIVARLHPFQHLVPAPLVDERLRRAAVHGVVVHTDIVGIEAGLQRHAPASLLFAVRRVLVGCRRVTDDEDGSCLLRFGSKKQQRGEKTN